VAARLVRPLAFFPVQAELKGTDVERTEIAMLVSYPEFVVKPCALIDDINFVAWGRLLLK
jgi:hypothetical protein